MTQYKYLKEQQESTWLNSPFQTPKNLVGFVYEIADKENGKLYIGLTRYWSKYTLPPLKGKKNKRHFQKETKWRIYNGSGNFQELINDNPDRFVKKILRNCSTITEMKCWETYYQLNYYTNGDWDKLYNEMINLRLRIPKT